MALFGVVAVLAFLSVGCLSQVIITVPPRSTTVIENGDASFTCMAEENGTEVTTGWRFTPNGSPMAKDLATGTNLTVYGIEMVTVSDGLRNMLTFSGVQREADGGMVVCLGLGVGDTPVSSPAILTVMPSSNIVLGPSALAVLFGVVIAAINHASLL